MGRSAGQRPAGLRSQEIGVVDGPTASQCRLSSVPSTCRFPSTLEPRGRFRLSFRFAVRASRRSSKISGTSASGPSPTSGEPDADGSAVTCEPGAHLAQLLQGCDAGRSLFSPNRNKPLYEIPSGQRDRAALVDPAVTRLRQTSRRIANRGAHGLLTRTSCEGAAADARTSFAFGVRAGASGRSVRSARRCTARDGVHPFHSCLRPQGQSASQRAADTCTTNIPHCEPLYDRRSHRRRRHACLAVLW